MKKNKTTPEPMTAPESLISGRITALICFIPLISVIFGSLFDINDSEMSVRPLMGLAFAAAVCFAFISLGKGRLTNETKLRLLLICGIILRVGYMMYTGWAQRGHDVGSLGADGTGHASYIINNILEGHLPDSNSNQFYHPPLYYMLSGAVIKFASFIEQTKDFASLIKYAMPVSCAASCVTLVSIQKIMDELGTGRKYQIPALAVAAFFPNFMLMGGRVNNDALVTMFMALAVYFTIKWYHSTDIKDIVFIALSIGLGMMTKISCGTVAIFTGPVMLYKLWEAFKNKNALPVIKQLALFALICFPLALWYPVRNYILFGQPLNYVLDLGTNSFVYTGDEPAVKRFFSVPLFEAFREPYDDPGTEYGIFRILTTTAVFGEWKYENVSKIISVSLYYANLILIIASAASMIAVCAKRGAGDKFSRYSMAALWLITFVSYISFNISLPFACSADTRYISLAVISGIVYLAKGYELCDTHTNAYIGYITIGGKTAVTAFCVLTALMYA